MDVKAVICEWKHKKEVCRSGGRIALAGDTVQSLKATETKPKTYK
jgi:hypothetical protein